MFRTRLILALLSVALMAGCANGKRTTKAIDANNDGVFEQTITNTDNVSQRTLRLQEKANLAQALCTLESNNLSDPERRIIAVVDKVKIYSQTIPTFDMAGCIAESMRWGGERLLNNVINRTSELLTLGAKGYAAVSIARRVLDNTGVSVDNVAEGATVAVSTDQAPLSIDQRTDQAGDGSTFNTCAGELIDGECVLPVTGETGAEEIDLIACGVPATCSGADAFLAGQCGEITPSTLACLSGDL